MIQLLSIPKRSNNCFSCSSIFQQGEDLHSYLFEAKEWIRKDFCLNCQISIDNFHTKWKSRIPKKPPILENDQEITDCWELLKKLYVSADLQDREEAFLLSLFLVRKKVLKEIKAPVSGEYIFEHQESGEAIFVKPPDLKKIAVHAVQKRLTARLKNGS